MDIMDTLDVANDYVNSSWEDFTDKYKAPKIARRSLSSAVSSVSPLGVTFPTRISPARTSGKFLMEPMALW